MVTKMVVVNDGREYDCMIIDDYIHYTHETHDMMINYKRKVNVYAKGTRTNLQSQTNDDYTKIHLFLRNCVSILLVSSIHTAGCDAML